MEKVVWYARNVALLIFLMIATVWIYRGLEKVAYEAFSPRYIEVPVFVEKWQKPPVEAASTSTEEVSGLSR